MDFKFVCHWLRSEKPNIPLQHMHKNEFRILTNKCENNLKHENEAEETWLFYGDFASRKNPITPQSPHLNSFKDKQKFSRLASKIEIILLNNKDILRLWTLLLTLDMYSRPILDFCMHFINSL